MNKKELEALVKQQAEQITTLTRQVRDMQSELMQERIKRTMGNQPQVLPMTPSTPLSPPWNTPTAPMPNKPWWQQVYCGTCMN